MKTTYTETLHDPLDSVLHIKESKRTIDLIIRPSTGECSINETKNGKTRHYHNTTRMFTKKLELIISQYYYDDDKHDKLFMHNWMFTLDKDHKAFDNSNIVAYLISNAMKSKDANRLLPLGVTCDRSYCDKPIEIDENREYDKGILKIMSRFMHDESLHTLGMVMPIGVWPDLNHTYAFLYAMRYHFGTEYIYDFIKCLNNIPNLPMMDTITDLLTLSKDDIDAQYDCENENITQYMKTHTPIKFERHAWHRYIMGNSMAQGQPLMRYPTYGEYRCPNNDFIMLWKDVLKMQLQMKNDITDKYPRFIKSEHHSLSMQLGLRTIDDSVSAKRVHKVNRHSRFEAEGDTWVAITPARSKDMLDEAAYQHNCLASYIESVAKGYTNVVFIRHKETPDVPWITVETDNNLNIKQAYLKYNRPPDDEANAAMSQWRKTIMKGRAK